MIRKSNEPMVACQVASEGQNGNKMKRKRSFLLQNGAGRAVGEKIRFLDREGATSL